MTEVAEAFCSSMSDLGTVTLVPSESRRTRFGPSVTIGMPLNILPSWVATVTDLYWSEMTFDGRTTDSRISTGRNRLLTVVRSGPRPAPLSPNLWQSRHRALVRI